MQDHSIDILRIKSFERMPTGHLPNDFSTLPVATRACMQRSLDGVHACALLHPRLRALGPMSVRLPSHGINRLDLETAEEEDSIGMTT